MARGDRRKCKCCLAGELEPLLDHRRAHEKPRSDLFLTRPLQLLDKISAGRKPTPPEAGADARLPLPRDLPDRLPLDEVLAPNPRNRLHDQHPPTTPLRIKAGSLQRPHFRGSILDADPPA